MGFGLADFRIVENVDRLRVIIMDAMEHYPLKPFKRLKPREQKRFNEKLNDYITHLPELEVDWNLQLQNDFNEVCQREIFTEDFDPEKVDIMRGVYPEVEKRLDAEDDIRHKEYEERTKKDQEEYDLIKKKEEEDAKIFEEEFEKSRAEEAMTDKAFEEEFEKNHETEITDDSDDE